jgi:hypothetical protein
MLIASVGILNTCNRHDSASQTERERDEVPFNSPKFENGAMAETLAVHFRTFGGIYLDSASRTHVLVTNGSERELITQFLPHRIHGGTRLLSSSLRFDPAEYTYNQLGAWSGLAYGLLQGVSGLALVEVRQSCNCILVVVRVDESVAIARRRLKESRIPTGAVRVLLARMKPL